MRELRTEIEINAPPERVWEVLTSFPLHADWNPFIKAIEGEPREGEPITVRMEQPGGRAMTFKPTLLRVAAARELRWLGRLAFPGVFDGEHIFSMEPLDSGRRTRLIQREHFRGFLVPFFWRSLNTATRQGFEEMNQALKERVEAGEGVTSVSPQLDGGDDGPV